MNIVIAAQGFQLSDPAHGLSTMYTQQTSAEMVSFAGHGGSTISARKNKEAVNG